MVQRVAYRYAKSLLDIAVDQNNLEAINSDMGTIKEALNNKDLRLLVKSPIIKPAKKIAIFKEIFGGSVDKVTMAFLEIVTKKGRENILLDLTTAFDEQYKKLQHVTGVKLTTAAPISEQDLAQIKSNLLKSTATDKEVDVETAVDPELIGGFVLQMGDKMYDASVAYQLEQVKKKFSDNKYIKQT
jgi:F-type H+-transporting ATPase subunit delta